MARLTCRFCGGTYESGNGGCPCRTELQIAFAKFHQANPQVYALVKRFAREAIDAGHQRFGIAAIWERVRWEVAMSTKDVDFKMPNNHRAYYARLWLKDHPQYSEFFRTAQLRSLGGHIDKFGRDIT